MSELSPAAQAVKDAVLALYGDQKAREMAWPIECDGIAAALRAAAEHCKCDDGKGYWIYRPNILAIANELEAQ